MTSILATRTLMWVQWCETDAKKATGRPRKESIAADERKRVIQESHHRLLDGGCRDSIEGRRQKSPHYHTGRRLSKSHFFKEESLTHRITYPLYSANYLRPFFRMSICLADKLKSPTTRKHTNPLTTNIFRKHTNPLRLSCNEGVI